MLHIIYSGQTHMILNYARKKKVAYPFVLLGNNVDNAKEVLCINGMKELSLYEPNEREKIDNEREYISTISMLDSEYDSFEWLAHGVSEKNEHTSSHYKNIVRYGCLINTIKRLPDLTAHIFVIGNNEIFKQLEVYCNRNHIKIELLENRFITHIKQIFFKFRFFISVLMLCIKTIIKKLYINCLLQFTIRRRLSDKDDYYVIRTRLDARFLTKGASLHDALFGTLPRYVLQHGKKVLILAAISNGRHYPKIVRKIKDTKNILTIPEDYFLGYSDILQLWKYLHLRGKRLNKKILFSGLDVTKIYEQEINNGYMVTDYLRNILIYFIAKRFAEVINFKIYIQTFENYAWEKLTILGIKKSKCNCKILGFQHAFISRNSFKYFLGNREMERSFLPDKIITMGTVTRSILERYGRYNNDIFTTGCALRQEYIVNERPFKRKHCNRIIVPLTMVRSESILILKFLYDSGLPGTKNTVVIRCHPAFPFEKFKGQIRFNIPDNFIISNQRSVKEELSDSDMVLYTWSTVAVEALRLGIPVVYLDILKPMYVDPLFECNVLKKTVAKEEELLPVIENIHSMSDESFYKEQQIAQEYLRGYFYPVNANTLAPFLV